ncbi:MAG: hypothetical protein ACRC1Z_15835 [Waterburya sp.]
MYLKTIGHSRIWKQELTFNQIFCLTTGSTILLYLLAVSPRIIMAFAAAFGLTYTVSNAIEFLSLKLFRQKIRISRWRFLLLSSVVCLSVIAFNTATVAQVFEDTETELDGIVENGDGVADFFSLIRVILIVGGSAGAGYAIYQGWRGNDYAAVAIGLGVAVLGIVGISVFQNLVLGN